MYNRLKPYADVLSYYSTGNENLQGLIKTVVFAIVRQAITLSVIFMIETKVKVRETQQ